MKFEEAFCTSKNRLFSIDEIAQLQTSNLKVFVNEYRDFFVCPECRKASLSFTNAVNPYFRSFPKSCHSELCSLRQDEMDADQTKEFLKDKKSDSIIAHQMESVLAVLLSKKKNQTGKTDILTTLQKSKSEKVAANKTIVTSKRLPRKRIDMAFCPEDFDCFKLFYGEVLLTWEKAVGQDYYKMLLSHPVKKKLLCKLKITNAVYAFFPKDYKSPLSYLCDIVFLASFKNKGKTYQSTELRTSQYLILTKSVT